ncbi:MAG: DNA polymerase IV [Gemmatimonadota bacterium]|nr:MAG: DNA polymerase IV [Gemmatimonadota bacterium]
MVKSQRTIIHLDLDAFFASVEQLDKPELRGRPVVVGADPKKGRGVVSAASYEAREYGIHSAMPISRAHRLCPHGAFLPVRMRRYKEISDRIMKLLKEYTPLIEQVSVDEAFLDVTGCDRLYGSAEAIGKEIRARVRKEEGLTISVGIAPNKYLAKMSSKLGKPDGFVIVKSGKEKEFLAERTVECLWGVGDKTSKKLREMGITTIGQLANYPPESLEKKMGKIGRRLWELAHGIDDSPVVTRDDVKSISHETTYGRDIENVSSMKNTLLDLSERVGRRARRKGITGKTITLKIRFADFTTFTRNRTLKQATNGTDNIYKAALSLLQTFELTGRKVRLLGVGISHLSQGSESQEDLFQIDEKKWEKVDGVLDKIEERYGKGTVKRAALLRSGTPRKS